MRNRLIARDIVERLGSTAGIPRSAIDDAFDGAPLDFDVIISPRLPLFAHRFGMIGITLAGSVWLLDRAIDQRPAALLSLLRHEAEHVRQQREHPVTFYARYALDFLRGITRSPGARMGTRFREAYLAIPYEREAYAADARARHIIDRHV